jgi:hypothetical protein
MTNVSQALRSPGVADAANRVMEAATGGAPGMPPPQPGTGGPGGGPMPLSPMASMAMGGNPPAQPSPLNAPPQGAG